MLALAGELLLSPDPARILAGHTYRATFDPFQFPLVMWNWTRKTKLVFQTSMVAASCFIVNLLARTDIFSQLGNIWRSSLRPIKVIMTPPHPILVLN